LVKEASLDSVEMESIFKEFVSIDECKKWFINS
jgi:hypothetical protein